MIRAALVVAAAAGPLAPLAPPPAPPGTVPAPPSTWAAAGSATVHIALRRSTPANGDTLDVVPRQLALQFTEAVELAVATVTLLAPDSTPVALSPLRHDGERRSELAADVTGPLVRAGRYTIQWAIVGRDGHPIRGAVRFTVLPDAAGLAPPPGAADTTLRAPADTAVAPGPSPDGTGGFDATSPGFAAIRWLGFVGLLGVIGALGMRAGVLARLRVGVPGAEALTTPSLPRVAAGGMLAAAVLIGAAGLRLLAQIRAVYVDSFAGSSVLALLSGTVWGWGWMLQVAAAAVALGALAATRRCVPVVAGDVTLGAAVVALAVSAAMSGHPAATHPTALAITLDAAHVLAAGVWLGTLGYVAAVGIPAARSGAPGASAPAVRALITTFSPLALGCGIAIVASGTGSAWLQLGSLEALWASDYGRLLLLKLAAVAAVIAAGAYNWRVATPRLDLPDGVARIRRSAGLELAFAVLVLAVTAVLVATPPPANARSMAARIAVAPSGIAPNWRSSSLPSAEIR